MKVYAVTEGSYSDYHVICLFTTRELAQEYKDKVTEGLFRHRIKNGWKEEDARRWINEYDIEEFEIYDMVPTLEETGQP